jgi:hypothetical protein
LPKNIIFFNAVSFYFYIKDFACNGKQTIEGAINRIEPYIPLKLTEDTLELFLDNMLEVESNQEVNIDLMTRVKGDFVYSIQTADSPERWGEILDTCESIRHMKESKLFTSLT